MKISNRKAVSTPIVALVIVVLVLAFASAYVWLPAQKQSQLPGTGGVTSTTSSGQQSGNCANGAPVSSELTTYNSQSISSGTVAVYQQNSAGTGWSKLPDASSSQTLNTFNTASKAYSLPFVALWNASAMYPQSFSPTTSPSTDSNGDNINCVVPQGSSNAVYVYQLQGIGYLGPASGTSATTNVESVVGSTSTQTNSFPAAFPTSQATYTVYLQGFANSIVGMLPVSIPASTNQKITNYGPATAPTSNTQTSGMVPFQGYALFLFNQTAISFSAPGAIQVPITGTTGEKAWLVPATSSGACSTAGTSTTAPCILSSITFSVYESIAATGKHVDMMVTWIDNTQGGYIIQNLGTPAVTAFHASGNFAGAPTSVTALSVPVGGTTGGIRAIITQSSAIIATY